MIDWRGKKLKQLRKIVLNAHPEIIEEWKWNSPVWSFNGSICSASAFKEHVSLNFFEGAKLGDTNGFFNSGLDSKKSGSIKFFENDIVNESALTKLIQSAAALNSKNKKI